MNDGERLLDAVRHSPDDMALRLVYSDWFEEQGQQPRADFIRASVNGDENRAAALLHRHRMKWDGLILKRFNAGPLRGKINARHGPVHRWEYRRGFIESLTVQPKALLEHGWDLLALGPIHELRLIGATVPWEDLGWSGLLEQVKTLLVSLTDWRTIRTPVRLAGEASSSLGGAPVFGTWCGATRNGPAMRQERHLAGLRGKGKMRVVFQW